MFSKSAGLYDIIYSFKDYSAESRKILDLIEKECPHAQTVLDVACGTAEHDKYLSKNYRVDGIDLDPEFVAIASRKNLEGTYKVADMMDFHLEKTYDVILCLFSSIAYVKTIDNVVKTLECFERHLNPNGVIFVEPWFTPDVWQNGSVHMLTAEEDDLKITRMNLSGREGNLSVLNFHYLVGQPGSIQYFTERHDLGLFTVDQMLGAFSLAGLDVQYEPEGLSGRGLYTARIPED